METLIYILKANLYCTLFYMCYWVLLRRHTFFKLNRLYLVGTLFLSLMLPFVEFTETLRVLPADIQTLPEPSVPLAEASSGLQIAWLQLTLIIYALGVVFMLANLMRGFYWLYLLLKQGEWIEMESYTLILLPETAAKGMKLGSFSFLNFLVICNHDYENCFDTILKHEHVHITQRHSYDVLLVEMLKVVFWFNPAVWFYKYSLREIHEFLADHQAENKEVYASFLVSYAQDAAFGAITNNFFNSFLLKDRIKMIYSKSTSYWSLAKYVLIVPIMTFAVMKTAAHNQVFVKALPEHVTSLSDGIKKSYSKTSQDSVTKFDNKTKVKPVTYIRISSKNNSKKKNSRTVKTSVLNSAVVYQDTLWENYRPKHSTYDYYNRVQKVRKITLLLPTLDKFGNAFDKSLNLSKQTPPATEIPNSRIGLFRYNQ